MFVVEARAPGGPDVLRLVERADPEPASGEVVLDVAATAVNRVDLLQRAGAYRAPPGASDLLGLECSGRVSVVGVGVTGWSVGDEVCALLAGGGYAERVAVPAGQLLPIPRGVGMVEAAGLPEAACTVWSNLIGTAGLRVDELALIHGGSGGIGSLAIQVAAAVGARAATTTHGPDRLRRCRDLGAEIVIDYREADFVRVVRDATHGRGADVVLDIMGGGSFLARNIEALGVGGRLVVIGLQAVRPPSSTWASCSASAPASARPTCGAARWRARTARPPSSPTSVTASGR